MRLFLTVSIILISYDVKPVNSWSGNTCSRIYRHFQSHTYCLSQGWWGCSNWGYIRRPYYALETYCCPGWRHSGNRYCNIPVCSPFCQNGGTCIRPNTCACKPGFQGEICGGLGACSNLKPCYPGRCYGSTSNSQCICSEGFGGTTCDRLEDKDYKPTIEKVNATFAKYLYTQGNRLLYHFMADSTNSTTTQMVWSNQPEFNAIMFDIDAFVDAKYVFEHTLPVPRYIRNHAFGIVEAKVEVRHYKLNRDLNEELVNQQTFKCDGPSNRTPIADETFKCRLSNGTSLFEVDSGDRYLLIYTVSTGGYRELIDTSTNNLYQTDIYKSISSQSVMEFRCDRDVPQHCSERNTCNGNQLPFQLVEDITKQPLRPNWNGWTDALSGVARYSFEVWKMKYNRDYDVLREPNIRPNVNPVPEFISSQAASNTSRPIYKPTTPGVYSTILEVVDMANNSRYARRIAIFDKESSITTRPAFPLYVASANNESNYEWQTTPNSGSSPSATVTLEVLWRNHFINQIHEDGHFLLPVQEYEPRLSDGISRNNYKRIEPKFDDNEGDRTLDAIPNVNSIIKFEFNYGTVSTTEPSSGWEEIPLLQQSKTKVLSGETILDGNTRKVWIRAHDVMGNTRIDSTVIGFDNSPPTLYDTSNAVERNVKDGKYSFSSRVTVEGKDEHSGIKMVSLKFIVAGTRKIKSQQNFIIKPKPPGGSCPGPNCNCIGQLCYAEQTVLEMNNCWLIVPIDSVENEAHELEIYLYNSAMLSSSRTIQLGKVDDFIGIKTYLSPFNITVRKTTDTSISLSWIQAATCYERVGIILKIFSSNSWTKDIQVDKDATSFVLRGLSPSTNYSLELYAKYGYDSYFKMSESPTIHRFTTDDPPKEPGLMEGKIIIIFVAVTISLLLCFVLAAVCIIKYYRRKLTDMKSNEARYEDLQMNNSVTVQASTDQTYADLQ